MIRCGIGYDVHRLAEGQKLILGGVEIPHSRGLEGHSDADVLLHAIADALLGAVGEGDIGQHFPNTDESIRGISSIEILRRVIKVLAEKKDAGREYRRNGSGRKTEACAAHCGDAKNNCRRDWHSGFECEYKGNHKRKTRRGRTQRRHRRNRDCNGGSRMNPLSFRAERGGVEKSLIGNREMFRLRST